MFNIHIDLATSSFFCCRSLFCHQIFTLISKFEICLSYMQHTSSRRSSLYTPLHLISSFDTHQRFFEKSSSILNYSKPSLAFAGTSLTLFNSSSTFSLHSHSPCLCTSNFFAPHNTSPRPSSFSFSFSLSFCASTFLRYPILLCFPCS